jgi:3-carboxy-cis,cis-muconate cycloisomerase
MLAVFDDAAVVRHALAFEAALARAQADCGLIPARAAEDIAAASAAIEIDPAELADEAAHSGTLAIPLVARLKAALRDKPDSADEVHRGATSQDLADTVMTLQAAAAAALLRADLIRLAGALAALAQRHAETPALGRTLLQDAVPITFGLRAAQWLAAIDGARRQLERACAEALLLQLGGAAGTRAGLGGRGDEVARHMAQALGLAAPLAPWHARRDRVAQLAAALGIVIGMIAKVALDIALLSQNAVGEAREPAIAGRGGSSSMPHKRNPTGCQVAISAATRAPGLVASILGGLAQEQERGLGGWQAEAPVLADLFMLAGGSASAMAAVVEGLETCPEAMGRNLEAADVGHDFGESAAIVATILEEHRKDG